MNKIEDLGFKATNELSLIVGDALSGLANIDAFDEFEQGLVMKICELVKSELSVPKLLVYTMWRGIGELQSAAKTFSDKEDKFNDMSLRLHRILKIMLQG